MRTRAITTARFKATIRRLRINPNYVEAFDSRGLAYAHKGGVDQAIQDYNQALRINPN
jgi:tetratricopeptide (TPR) repeat protein